MPNKRTIEDFRAAAVLHWPEEIRSEVAKISVLPLLLETQEQFIGIFTLAGNSPEGWKGVLSVVHDAITGALFLKHLMVLADVGGEALNKLTPISRYFPEKQMHYIWRGSEYTYIFKELADCSTANNSRLGVTEKNIASGVEGLSAIQEDVVMLILHGGAAIGSSLPPEIAEKCILGNMLGQPAELKAFLRQNYIKVSRQVQGGVANALGALTQSYVSDLLSEQLPGWLVERDRPLTGVTHRIDEVGTNFDVRAVSPNNMQFGIEVSFQVTTNSTIERKAREAATVRTAVHAQGHRVCYVIDGAGNINVRDNAIQTIFDNSDMTVAFSQPEIRKLADYMTSEDKTTHG